VSESESEEEDDDESLIVTTMGEEGIGVPARAVPVPAGTADCVVEVGADDKEDAGKLTAAAVTVLELVVAAAVLVLVTFDAGFV